jgi:pimeloyl-ACP methyl ester carboxylesterase
VPDLPSALAKANVRTPEDVTDEMAEDAVRRFNDMTTLPSAQRSRILELARRDLWLTARGRDADASAPPDMRTLLVAGADDPLSTIDKLPPSAKLGYENVVTIQGGHLFLFDKAGVKRLVELISDGVAAVVGDGGPAA